MAKGIFSFSLGLVVLSFTFASPLLAQKGSARLEGVVTDPTGGVVPGVSIIALNEETAIATEAVANETGYYVFPALPVGVYTVTAEMPGFKRVSVKALKLDIASTVVQNFRLELGEVTETVTVSGQSTPAIQSTTSDLADTVAEMTIKQLPLNGRQPLELVQLLAGVAGNQHMSERGSASDQGANYAGLGANGARAVYNAVYLDGVDITNSEFGTGLGIAVGTDISQSVDAIGEFRVISANPTAEFGKNSGMQIEIATKSGTNEWHGSLYEFHRNTVLNANNFFNNLTGIERPQLLRNQFGGNIGGPVILPWLYNGKNKTFFFFNYEGFREVTGTSVERTVLTPEARNGIFRYNKKGPNGTGLVDPVSGKVLSQFANDIGVFDPHELDLTRWDGIGRDTSGVIKRYISLMAAPNFYGSPGGNRDGLNFASFRFNAPDPERRNNTVIKIDHLLSRKHSLSGRYSNGEITRLANLSPYPGLSARNREERQNGVGLSLISNFAATITNEARLGFSRNLRRFDSALQRPGEIIVDCNSAFDCLGITDPDLTGEESLTARQTLQFTDNVSWNRGKHQFKSGFTFRSHPLNVQQFSRAINLDFNTEPRNQQPAAVDLRQLTGDPIPIHPNDRINASNFFNFVNGRWGGVIGAVNASSVDKWGDFGTGRIRGFRQREMGAFFQDDWRITRHLTFNLGLRYELFFVPFEVNSFFTQPTNRNLLDPQIDTTLVSAPIEFGAIGPKSGRRLYPNDFNNFAPVIGFSWDPFGTGKTAIRASYRIAYDQIFTGTLNTIDIEQPGLRFESVINADTLRDNKLFNVAAPGGVNAGQPRSPRLSDLKGTSVGSIQLNGAFDLAAYLSTPGVNIPGKPLGPISETRHSLSPYQFTRDFSTAYAQSWSLSIQREVMRNTVLELRYVGRKGTKEYLGLPGNEFRAPATYVKEMQELQYLLTGGGLGRAPANLPPGFTKGKSISISTLFGSAPNNATNYSQFKKGSLNSYAFATFPLLYPFFLAGQNSFDTAVASPIQRNDYVSTLATLDNRTNPHNNAFLTSVPLNAVPSGQGLQTCTRLPGDPRRLFGCFPIIVGVQPNIFRPNPQFLNGPRVTGNAAYSSYHAFQLQLQRRFYEGLQFQFNYTLAKNFDVTSVSQPTGQDVISFFEVHRDYAVSDNDVTHDVKLNWIWNVPVGRERRFLNGMHPALDHILGGWQVAGFMEASTDFPYNIAANGRDRTAAATTGGIRPSFVPGVKRTNKTNDIGEVKKTGSGVVYFDSKEFEGLLTRTFIGELGDVPRNYWRGPGFFNVDLLVMKSFGIREGVRLDFRAEFFNLLNRANFANPNLSADRGPYVDLSIPGAGKIIDTLGNPRLVQFALKLVF